MNKELYKSLIKIAWPSALEGLLLSLMNSFDTMMVGKLGASAIAAVGVCAQPRLIILMTSQAMGIACTAIVARRKGEGRREEAVSTLKQALLAITILNTIILTAGLSLAEPFLRLAGANDEIIHDAVTYYRVTLMPLFFSGWTLSICGALRGIGKTKTTLYVNVTSNVVNVFFNYCLIEGHLGFPAWGVFGAALATSIGTVVSSVFAFVSIFRNEYLDIRKLGSWKLKKETVTAVAKVGSGTLTEYIFLRFGFLMTSKVIGGLGTIALASYQVASQVTSLAFTVGDGLGNASTSLVGQSLGEGNKDKAKKYIRCSQLLGVLISVTISAIILLFRYQIISLFTEDVRVISGVEFCFFIIAVALIPQDQRVVMTGCLRGAGDVKYTAFCAVICVSIIRPLAAYIFSYITPELLGYGAYPEAGAWMAFLLDALIRTVLLSVHISKGKWMGIKI